MHIYWNPDYVASQHEIETTRKSHAIVTRLSVEPNPRIKIVDPMADFWVDGVTFNSCFDEVAREHIERIHTPEYIQAVETGKPGALARSQGFNWDPGIYTMALAHTTGLIAAVHHAMSNFTRSGSLSSGLHHARPGTGSGYCTFNGLAAAASYAISAWELKRVLVLDFDAHGGGGTDEIIANHFPDQVVHADLTTSPFDGYVPREGSFFKKASPHNYLVHAEMMLNRVFSDDPFDLVIYNAGMDPINTGVSVEDIVERERMVHHYIGDTPAVFALAGGYTWGDFTMDDVVNWHLITMETWANYGKVGA